MKAFLLPLLTGSLLWAASTATAAEPLTLRRGAHAEMGDAARPGVITDAGYLSDAVGQPAAACQSCGGHGGSCCAGTCNIWVDADYLLWWTESRNLPPLVTTSDAGTARAQAGVLGQPTTSVLFGGQDEGGDALSGGRLNFGKWLDDCQSIGIGGRFWGIGGSAADFSASSDQLSIVARPFFNTQLGQQDASLIAFPGELEGQVDVRLDDDVLAAESFVRILLTQGHGGRIDFIGGYHFTRVDNSLAISSLTTSIDPGGAVPIGTTFDVVDEFDATNNFHGGQFGFLATANQGPWLFSTLLKLSIGNVHQEVTVAGETTIEVPGGPTVTTPGGLLAQPTNIGVFERDKFIWVPEVNVTLGYCLTERLDLTVGYSFIYWTNLALANDIDTSVNPTQFGGLPLLGDERPAFSFSDSDYWAQGLSFGLHGTF